MKTVKFALFVSIMIGILMGLSPVTWAGAGASDEFGCCLVTSPGGGALAIKGTWTVVFTPPDIVDADVIPANVDLKLRLERAGKFGFFELNIKENILDLSNLEIACICLNPDNPLPAGGDTNTPDAVSALVDEILLTFFPDGSKDSNNTRLVITRSSISFTDGPTGGVIPGSDPTRTAAMGDILIYVVDPADAKLDPEPVCQ